MSLPGYDAWLERPYVEAAAKTDAFERFCEAEGLDPDNEDSWSAFEEHLEETEGPDPDEARDRAFDKEHGLR